MQEVQEVSQEIEVKELEDTVYQTNHIRHGNGWSQTARTHTLAERDFKKVESMLDERSVYGGSSKF